jgi:hypothetical protein
MPSTYVRHDWEGDQNAARYIDRPFDFTAAPKLLILPIN